MAATKIESGYFGEGGVGLRAIESRIRIYTTSEIAGVVSEFEKRTNLKRSQFAINGWGFPFIPLPEARREYGNIRNAPRNVSISFFGHPIYWIDPELTKRLPGEQEQEWCIRMFLLIDAMGYWNERGEFVDFLKVNEFSFDKAQVETYFNIAAQENETDSYSLLDVSDLDTSLESVKEEYEKIIEKCFRIQSEESAKALKTQVEQYHFAKNVLGDKAIKWSATFDEQGSVWDRKFRPVLDKLAREYNSRLQKGNTMTSDILRETRKIYDMMIPFVMKCNYATTVLEIPTKIAIKGDIGGAARISLITTSMEVAAQRDNIQRTLFADIDKEIRGLQSGLKPHGYDAIIREMEKTYSLIWDRLRLAFINFNNLRSGDRILTTTIELNTYLQSRQVGSLGSVSNNRRHRSSLDGLSSVLEEDFR